MHILLDVMLALALNLMLTAFLQRRLLLLAAAQRQQLTVYRRKVKRPRILERDRLFWMALALIWPDWKFHLAIVKPETVIRWQRRRFAEYWRRLSRSRNKPGRPGIPKEHVAFIRRISIEHPRYGARRIAGMLLDLFGVKHAHSTIDRYRVRPPNQPRGSRQWRTFLKNQADGIWCCDFAVQFTLFFVPVYIFIVMEIGSRRVRHVNVTDHPTLDWVKQQIRYATDEKQPKFLIHDNDGIYGRLGKNLSAEMNGKKVSCRSSLDYWLADVMDIKGIATPYHAPNANAYCERFIGTLRRECLDPILFYNERHIYRAVKEYISFYNQERHHQGILAIPDPADDIQESRERKGTGKLVSKSVLNGLHHTYRLAA